MLIMRAAEARMVVRTKKMFGRMTSLRFTVNTSRRATQSDPWVSSFPAIDGIGMIRSCLEYDITLKKSSPQRRPMRRRVCLSWGASAARAAGNQVALVGDEPGRVVLDGT